MILRIGHVQRVAVKRKPLRPEEGRTRECAIGLTDFACANGCNDSDDLG